MINLWTRNFARKSAPTQHTSVKSYSKSPLKIDIHSHLLPGIDDGSTSLEQSLEMIKIMEQMGYQKLITTPHIMRDFYKNTPEIIKEKLAQLKDFLVQNKVKVDVEAAAEYYFDEGLIHKVSKGEELLTIADKYLLFETGFMTMPQQFFEVVFEMQAQGLQPLFAHPERYTYLQDNFDLLHKIHDKGVLLQINLNSLNGYYGKPAKELAEKIIAKGWVSFVGSDCHKMTHLQQLSKTFEQPSFQKMPLNSLLNEHL